MIEIEKDSENRATQSLEPPRVLIQRATSKSSEEAIAQLPCHCTLLRRKQRARVVTPIANPKHNLVSGNS